MDDLTQTLVGRQMQRPTDGTNPPKQNAQGMWSPNPSSAPPAGAGAGMPPQGMPPQGQGGGSPYGPTNLPPGLASAPGLAKAPGLGGAMPGPFAAPTPNPMPPQTPPPTFSPVPPTGHQHVPPAAQRYNTAQAMGSAVANNWQPNPMLLQAMMNRRG